MHTQTAMFARQDAAAAPTPTPPPLPPLPRSIASSFSILWEALDVRAMVLLSLLLQIVLFVLGKRRKHSLSLINKIILWIAYQSKEWVIIAALGKLPNTQAALAAFGKPSESKETREKRVANASWAREIVSSDLLTSLWAPLLILHLGGPDSITAYSFQDTQLWTRHLLTLVVQSFLGFCVIFWSLIPSWSLVFTIPLYFVGINKYIERILCLKVTDSMRTKRIISIFKNPDQLFSQSLDHQSKIVLLGYALFSVMRPDVNDYLRHKEYPLSFKGRIETYLEQTMKQITLIQEALLKEDHSTHFNVAMVELGFIFDVVYTKAAFIYTRKGCFLRLTSFTLSIGILLFFLTSIMGSNVYDFFPVDVCITISLLAGAVALDICAVFSILCSDWVVILMHDNCLVRKILQYVLHCFPYFLRRQKRWLAKMGQFNLLDYHRNSVTARVNGFLENYCSSNILENWLRFNYMSFVEVPSCLKSKEVYRILSDVSFEATRGKKTLDELGEENPDLSRELECSIKVDFDASIIAWHLVTSICYLQDSNNPNIAPNEAEAEAQAQAMQSSKYLSDYMMYLLVMRPAMLMPDNCRSFWLDRALDDLRKLVPEASDVNAVLNSLWLDPSDFSSQDAMKNLPKYAAYLATKLDRRNINRWKLIKAMWIEMLLYAAHSCQHVNHVRHLGQYGQEFLSIIWVMGGHSAIQEVMKE